MLMLDNLHTHSHTQTARRTNEIKELEHEQLIAKSIQVKIKNIESDIASADEQLVLEEGPLMKHTRFKMNCVVIFFKMFALYCVVIFFNLTSLSVDVNIKIGQAFPLHRAVCR